MVLDIHKHIFATKISTNGVIRYVENDLRYTII